MAAPTQRQTVKIKMLRETRGSDNGYTVETFHAGREYEVGASLAKAFVDDMRVAQRCGVAGAVDAVKAVAAKVVEAVTPAPAEEPAPAPPPEPEAAVAPEGEPAPAEEPAATGRRRKPKD